MQHEPRLLITGASGQLGRRTAEIALGACPAERLILVSRRPEALANFASRGVEVRRGDFARPESLRHAFAGAGRVLLVSATDLNARAAHHRAAIDAAVAAGAEQLIYTSGPAPAPPNPAAVAPSHFATEQHLAAVGVPFTVLRNSLYSEYQLADAERAIRTGVLVHNRGEGRIAYVSRQDCAAAAAAVLVQGRTAQAVYDITGPEAFSAADLARLYSELSGRPVEAVALDDAAFVEQIVGAASDDDHLKYGAELVASFGRAIREGFMDACTGAVEALTGRPAQTLRAVLESAGLGS